VEGWHTGPEWIDSGTLSERINFAASEFLDDESPGMTDLIRRVGGLMSQMNLLNLAWIYWEESRLVPQPAAS